MYAMMLAPCCLCQQTFAFNPTKVPSLMIEGKRQPMCRPCLENANELRKQHGVEPWPDPHPDAYAPCSAEELDH